MKKKRSNRSWPMIPPSRSFLKTWKLSIKNLPKGKDELLKARKKNIPLFPYASEERFRDLFLALREDARTNSTLLFPHKPMTGEMQGRLNPSLLDLAVAIVAGVAGAYTKAYKEILQSLAGVAIAVALVPPLAVAGIGLGRLDFYFFGQAFLLFSTNLVGITLAGSFTFRVLGYSAAVRDRRSIKIVVLALSMITVPLYLSYVRIVEKTVLERSWRHERFLVNGKYLIVQKADLNHYWDRDVMTMDLLAREVITQEDLTLFREKMQANFDKKLGEKASKIG